LKLASRTDFQRPVWRHRLLHSENHTAPASECCISKQNEGQRPQSPAEYQSIRSVANGCPPENCHSCRAQRRTGESPNRKSLDHAERACSTKIAATAWLVTLHGREKSRHSCIFQRESDSQDSRRGRSRRSPYADPRAEPTVANGPIPQMLHNARMGATSLMESIAREPSVRKCFRTNCSRSPRFQLCSRLAVGSAILGAYEPPNSSKTLVVFCPRVGGAGRASFASMDR